MATSGQAEIFPVAAISRLPIPIKSKLHRVVKRRWSPILEAVSYPCQGWAVCIIVTSSPPELLPRRFLLKAEEELRENCVRRIIADNLAASLWQFEVQKCSSLQSSTRS
jgi:hypothetical protein